MLLVEIKFIFLCRPWRHWRQESIWKWFVAVVRQPEGKLFRMIHEILQINMLSDHFEKLTTKGVDITYIIDACHSGKLAGGMDGSKHTSYALKILYHEILLCCCLVMPINFLWKAWVGERVADCFRIIWKKDCWAWQNQTRMKSFHCMNWKDTWRKSFWKVNTNSLRLSLVNGIKVDPRKSKI